MYLAFDIYSYTTTGPMISTHYQFKGEVHGNYVTYTQSNDSAKKSKISQNIDYP